MDREDSGQMAAPEQSPARPRGVPMAVLIGCAVIAAAGFVWWRATAQDVAAEPQARARSPRTLADIFPKWDKPDLVLLLSGQQHGYLQPCGCSKPQFGGLTRRYNLLELLRKGGWPTVAVDLGDIPQRNGLQTMLKYTKSMEALRLMEYAAVGLGEYEIGLGLLSALGNYTLNHPAPPVLSANLRNRDKDQMFHGLVGSWRVTAVKGQPRVGIMAAVGQSVQDQVKEHIKDPDVAFDTLARVLPQALREIQARKPEFLVLLYQGSVTEAKRLAQALPNFNVIVCLANEEEPPSIPEKVGNTSIITLGHKGRYVGVVGAYRTGKRDKPFTLRYHLVALGEELDTPEDQIKGNPVMKVMEDYAREVKRNDFLGKAARRQAPHSITLEFPKATYAGSEACKRCHQNEYDIWRKSPHAHAYHDLETAKHPSLRQYDSECIACHVTGWGHKGGFTDEVKTKHLKDNGCENCHGPASEHIRLEIQNKGPERKLMRHLINPYRFDPNETPDHRKRRINLIDMACQKCHDIENDVNWKIDKWWDRKIVHSGDVKKP